MPVLFVHESNGASKKKVMTFYLAIPVQHKSLTMPASFRGREGGVDWDKKELAC